MRSGFSINFIAPSGTSDDIRSALSRELSKIFRLQCASYVFAQQRVCLAATLGKRSLGSSMVSKTYGGGLLKRGRMGAQ